MARHAAPATHTVATTMWAAISEDVPPQIYEVGFHRKHMHRQDLRHIKVRVVPIKKKRVLRRQSAFAQE